MNKKISLLAIVALGVIISCSDETTIYQDDLQDNVVVETSESKLEGSISFTKAGVLEILEEETITNKSAAGKAEELAGDYPLTLVAQVDPPTYGGSDILTATHVHVDGSYAYVSYNTPGAQYFGAIQVINIGNPNKPRVTSQLIYLNADLNAIQYHNGYVYTVGGVDAEKSVRATSNSFIAKIASSNGKLNISGGISYGFQVGFNANAVLVDGSSVLVTSGKDGTLTSYNTADLTIENEAAYSDLRSVAVDNGNIALLDASTGVRILNSNFQPVKEIPIGTDFGAASKKTIDFDGDKIIVAEADKGAGVYSYATGSLLEYIPILIDPEGVAESDINTNAVAINDDVILMANGGAGLCLSEKGANNSDVYGIIVLDGSTNFVESKDDYVFAASGKEGLQIIKLNRPSESLASRCATLPFYQGSSKLLVNTGDNVAYQGAKRFNNINNSGSLLLCGSWTVTHHVFINDNALFEMNGSLTVGRNNRRRNITVDNGATFRVEGNLNIYGDLVLEDGATIEFIGTGSVVNIFGSVIKNGSTTVTGTFEDVRNKF